MTDPLQANSGSVLTLADFTGEALLIPQFKARDMAEAIAELSRVFPRFDPRWDAEKLNQIALEREQQMSTAMEFGAAFPHVRSDACPELRFALGCATMPFRWGRPGALSVEFVFLNAVPLDQPTGYLKLLSGMARLGREPDLIEQLRAAPTPGELLAVLAKIPIRK